MMEPGYKEYLVSGVKVQAKKSDGGKFYFIILPNGERLVHLSEVFEKLAKEVTSGNSTR
jgi:hypothetical protein